MLDEYLTALINGSADALQLKDGGRPILFFGHVQNEIDMLALPTGTVNELANQWLSEDQRQALNRSGRLNGCLSLEKFGNLEYVFRIVDEQYVLALRPQKATEEGFAEDETQKMVRRLNAATSIESLLIQSVQAGASDIVLSANRPTRVRFGHGFFALNNQSSTSDMILSMLGNQLNERALDTLHASGSVDLAVEYSDQEQPFRFRVNVFKQFDGLAASWRPIRDDIPTLSELDLPDAISMIEQIEHGLVLISGRTGSGKSTTVAALLDEINRSDRRHIVTLEDPVEYRFVDRLSMIHQREVGEHVDSFSTGLRAALREAPNIIFVGEMRDLETISAALTAAETGHLVVSTLHSGSCVQALERIIDVFPEQQQQQVRVQLAEVLKVVVTQRLLPRVSSQLRVPACEVLVISHAISNLIRERRTHQIQSSLQIGKSIGMLPFEHSLIRLIERGLITPETALTVVPDSKNIASYLEVEE